jgi:hypothetical protein
MAMIDRDMRDSAAQGARARWAAPTVTRLAAGKAENGAGPKLDNQVTAS